jgi:hypothetical protein
MTTPIAAELYVPEFVATGTPGEYTIADAKFTNYSDTTGNGAFDLVEGSVLYAPATDPFTAMAVAGVVHRYRITSLTVMDVETVSATILWDEQGEEEHQPTSGSFCALAEVTPNNKLGLIPSDKLYSNFTPGTTDAANRSDVKNILDNLGGASLNSLRFSFAVAMEEWTIAHNQNSDRFILVTRDENGNRFYAGEQVVDLNTIRIQGTEPMKGTADILFL